MSRYVRAALIRALHDIAQPHWYDPAKTDYNEIDFSKTLIANSYATKNSYPHWIPENRFNVATNSILQPPRTAV